MTPTRIDDHCTIDVLLTEADLAEALRRDAREGLTATPKHLPPKWFYDERGSLLFDDITRLEEYYPTRRETEILEREAPLDRRAHRCHHPARARLGHVDQDPPPARRPGVAWHRSQRIVPFDVCEPILVSAGPELAGSLPGCPRRRGGGRLRTAPRSAPHGGHHPRRVPRRHDRQPHPRRPGQVPRRARRPDGPGRLAAPRHRPGEGSRPARRGLRRRRRCHRRVQPQHPPRPQPGARRRPRARPVRPRCPVGRRAAVDRDAPARGGSAAGATSAPSTSTSASRTASSSTPRSAPSSPARGSRRSWRRPAWSSTELMTDAAGDFALTLSRKG